MCTVNLKYGENNVNVGPLKEIPEICVDHFFGDDLKSTAFFLSHAHTDHMVGLESGAKLINRLNDPGVKLYCHALTPVLLTAWPKYLGGPEGQENLIRQRKLVPLDAETPYTIEIPSAPDNFYVTVTLLPAGHCPGSVMFLFETETVKILHTGDFRLSLNDLKAIRHLHEKNGTRTKLKKIDHLYVDTTFCSFEYGNLFPCRKDVIQKAIGHVRDWITQSDENWVFIKMAARFAHEYILLELYKTFQKKIHVQPDRHEIYSMIPGLDKVTTLDPRTAFHLCGDKNCIQNGESMEMRLTSMWYTSTSPQIKGRGPRETVLRTDKRLSVCYSMHSSLQEIAETIDYLKPTIVTPLVMPVSSNLKEVKEALRERCKVTFIYDDYHSQKEFISGGSKGHSSSSSINASKPATKILTIKEAKKLQIAKHMADSLERSKLRMQAKAEEEEKKRKEEKEKQLAVRNEYKFKWKAALNLYPSTEKEGDSSSESQSNSQNSSDGDSPLRLIKCRYPEWMLKNEPKPSTSKAQCDLNTSNSKSSEEELTSDDKTEEASASSDGLKCKRKLDFESMGIISPVKKSPKVSSEIAKETEKKCEETVCDINNVIDLTLEDDDDDGSETDFEIESNSSSSQNSQSLLSSC